ncbi:hypothetical protein Aab01nite_79060 [Paractinoplanes abujensis]|uniref:non-specific serine/threonine protein kinase n=1 Tax=Paractinoplanes abujensis TaxID=882441 RepID=A0A7W7CP85_9ACTN|nr:serine/threonine-protein kinase [Actinoplanes abujensis]MBB4692204.1 serine/threonine-protein kinase [Actinoplanes abujensis]GID24316.1 hypothetical protein Aab01nite_79060 [Actinoplanes abujensis]
MDTGTLIGGRYRLGERLGHGGMSVVWRACDEVLGRDVAVKLLAPELAAEPAVLRRLRDEARAAAALRHPGIVAVHDYGGSDPAYVVMELVEGRSLAALLKDGALPWRTAVTIGAQVAAALAEAHARGLVHRDVKPANVMVTPGGAKLVDFGISATVGAADDPAGEMLGTPAYLAPERIAGSPVRPATDVYALGLLLHLALAGSPPWRASTVTQMLKAHVYAEPAALPPVMGLPAAVVDLVRCCLAKKPGDRPSAAEVAALLGEVAGLTAAPPLDVAAVEGRAGRSLRRIGLPTRGTGRAGSARLLEARRGRVAVGALSAAALVGGGLAVWAGAGPGDGATRGAAAAAAPPVAGARPVADKAAEPRACTVRYALRGAAGGRASAKVTIHNSGEVAVPAWKLSFALPSGQKLIKGWSASWKQDGRAVVASGGRLPAGASAATGFSTSYGDVATLPVSFRLNGTTCQAQMSVQAMPAARPAPPAAGKAPEPAGPKAKDKPKKHDDEDEDDEDE